MEMERIKITYKDGYSLIWYDAELKRLQMWSSVNIKDNVIVGVDFGNRDFSMSESVN